MKKLMVSVLFIITTINGQAAVINFEDALAMNDTGWTGYAFNLEPVPGLSKKCWSLFSKSCAQWL